MVGLVIRRRTGKRSRRGESAEGLRSQPEVSVQLRRREFAARSYAGVADSARRAASPDALRIRSFARRNSADGGGDKTGNERWYDTQVPVADRLYDEHLAELKKEGKL